MVKEVVEQVIGMVRVQDWYGVAVLLLPMLVQLFKRPGFWDRLPAKAQPLVPVFLASFAGFTEAFVTGESFGDAAWQAVSAGIVVGLGAIGIYETYWRLKNGAKVDVLMLLCFILPALPSMGCAASLESTRNTRPLLTGASPRDSTRCQQLDDRRTTWGAVATGAVVMGGGSGIGSIPISDRDTELALKAGAAGMAVVAGVAHYVEQQATESWTRECSR